MTMMGDMRKQQEKQVEQEKFDKLMLRMTVSTMDSRSPMDAASGQFMGVQEVLDKNKQVSERHLISLLAELNVDGWAVSLSIHHMKLLKKCSEMHSKQLVDTLSIP
jgi:hypothetical protein